MIDPRKEMIIIKNEDKTLSIEHYEYARAINRYQVTFRNSDKVYNYNAEKVVVLTTPQPYDASSKQIFYGGKIISESKKVLHFFNATSSYFRFFKNNGSSYSIPEKNLSIRDIKRTSLSLEQWFKSQKKAFAKESMTWLNNINHTLSDTAQQNLVYFFQLAKRIELIEKENTQNNEDESSSNARFIAQCYEELNSIHDESILKIYLEKGAITSKKPTSKSIFPFYFNLSQKTAFENALNNSISIIEGPPGTGKTQTILNILAHFTMEGKSTGVVSFNNKAVKNIKEKLEKKGYHFLVAELGNNKKRTFFFDNQPKCNIDTWEEENNSEQQHERLQELTTTLDELLHDKNRLATLEVELSKYRLEQSYFEKFFLTQRIEKAAKLSFTIKDSDHLMEYLADTALEDRLHAIPKFFQKIKILFTYRVSHFGKSNEETFENILWLQKKFYELKIDELQSSYDSITQKLQNSSFTSLQEEHQKISESIFKKSLFCSHGKQKFEEFPSGQFKEKFTTFSEQYPIILSTAHSIRKSLQGNILDYIIIDEASQLDLLTGVLALSCCKNIIIVGDTKQIQHIARKEAKKQMHGYPLPKEYDYFNQNILSSFISLYGDAIPRITLKEHYRCHPKIIQFCNEKFYNNELIPLTDVSCCDAPLILVQDPEGNHMRVLSTIEEKGRYNQRELDISKELFEGKRKLASDDIGFISPYRKQVTKAAKQFSREIESDTVHRFQGREKEVIIMSTVLDSKSTHRQCSFVDNACLINVAISRAQKQFVLVTDTNYFENSSTNIADFIRYIRHNYPQQCIKSDRISAFDLLYKSYSKKLEPLKQKIAKNSLFDSENIARALLEEILEEEAYQRYSIISQQYLYHLTIPDIAGKRNPLFTEQEYTFIKNNSSVDFVIINRFDKSFVLVIEVDGFSFHENNSKQMIRDELKSSILKKVGLPLLRLPTNGSGEKEKIKRALDNLE